MKKTVTNPLSNDTFAGLFIDSDDLQSASESTNKEDADNACCSIWKRRRL